MVTMCIDISKYTGHVDQSVVQRWKELGVMLAIIQAHPEGYGQPRSLELMRACEQGGLTWDTYIYQYMAYPDWMTGALHTMDLAAAEGLVPREGWLDVEDVEANAERMSVTQRVATVQRDLALFDQWLAAHERPRAGIYSGYWYWTSRMGNTTEFADRELWDSDYDEIQDTALSWTPYGGWWRREIKQFRGTSVLVVGGLDQNVLSDAEIAELTTVGGEVDYVPDVDWGWQERKTEIVQTAGELVTVADQIEAEARRKYGPRRAPTVAYAGEVRSRAHKILGT